MYLSVELTSNTCVLQVVFVIWGRIYTEVFPNNAKSRSSAFYCFSRYSTLVPGHLCQRL
ncbi:hypothetical protein ANAPC1_01447 [Anaplasma phagocytophilum]|uniref:Uncharacterized protein n=1 Tax=Anaplasma phagocytophilum TaxID=948 RepID=A0AA45UUD5_ANAPH|nr:hypothetical protein ANAPC1_01447 [Anaplasma phagocytophilum]SCV62626.1 hypothetical protein ANAPH1_00248 [Anaplasma phagocytophilum]SCV65944.1 hypothetical protein ANAPRD1_00959 [Anaplasma phagocytophilum]